MFKLFMEAELPKLSQTSLYAKMNTDGIISNAVKDEIRNAGKTRVTPDKIQESLSLMKLNGGGSIKKVIKAFEEGSIVVLFNPEHSKIPSALPYIVINHDSGPRAYIFADKLVTKINSQKEYINLMAAMEAAYYALAVARKPALLTMNREILITLCNIYTIMVTLPLEQRLYIKGENLIKAMLYTIFYFYRIVDGPEKLSTSSVAYKKIISDKVPESMVKQIIADIQGMESNNFVEYLTLIKKINPIRYENLDVMYLQHFVSSDGASLIFALENPAYLFLLVTSAFYKTQLTSFNLNKIIGPVAKKCITLMQSV